MSFSDVPSAVAMFEIWDQVTIEQVKVVTGFAAALFRH
jgi:hypothetical protein